MLATDLLGKTMLRAAMPPPQAVPPPTQPPYPYAAPPAQKSGSGCVKTLACGCLTLIVLVVICGAGTYFAITSGVITQTTVLNLVGLGPADIEVDNFRDDRIQVNIQQLDVSQDSTPVTGALRLNPFDIQSFRVPTAGKYRVNFATNSNAVFATCTLNLRSGDQFQFVTLPEKTVVNRVNSPSNVGRDLVVQTSALCR